ncbi:COQ9 family protein [Nioella nitratireducens]|uniref:COQ9 family protein n=1 Tax=Nioella nitratireducens TaxID=1287720 RepID=UPI000A04AA57|nr:COQ9 family protein [Nioella nitratireducens]
MQDLKDQILDAALIHVVFDGWSDATLKAAVCDTGTDEAAVRALFPRGPVDLAVAFHRRGDAAMVAALTPEVLAGLKIREKITHAIRTRLELMEMDKEAVRRGTTLFALPIHAGDGARALWETADAIWTTIGDTSDDHNWYTKRMTLSGVYSSVVLYWLGDHSEGHAATWAFLDRRIEDVMRFEKFKAQVNKSPLLKPLMAGPNWLLGHIKPPRSGAMADMPGHWGTPKRQEDF